jgi:hypothetical protein
MSGPSRTRAASLIATIAALLVSSFVSLAPVRAQDQVGDFGASSPPPASEPAPAGDPPPNDQPASDQAPNDQASGQPAASAQPAAQSASSEPASSAPPEETPPGPSARAVEVPVARPMPAPIMVVVIPSGRAPEDVANAARDAVIAQVTPMTGGRPVLPLMAPALRDAIAACTEPTCIGGQIAGAGAFGAILVRLSRRTARGPTQLTLEMVDPVSGSPRLTPLTGTIADAASAAATLQPLTAQLEGVMFSAPPPPPTLLVTVNVDGAHVRVDETDLGESPVARTTLVAGRHVVTVTRAGYVSSRRTIELNDGQNERLDVILSPSTATMGDDTITGTGTAGGGTPLVEEPLFWVAIGGGVLVIAGIAIGVGVAVGNSGPAPNPMGIPLPPIEP